MRSFNRWLALCLGLLIAVDTACAPLPDEEGTGTAVQAMGPIVPPLPIAQPFFWIPAPPGICTEYLWNRAQCDFIVVLAFGNAVRPTQAWRTMPVDVYGNALYVGGAPAFWETGRIRTPTISFSTVRIPLSSLRESWRRGCTGLGANVTCRVTMSYQGTERNPDGSSGGLVLHITGYASRVTDDRYMPNVTSSSSAFDYTGRLDGSTYVGYATPSADRSGDAHRLRLDTTFGYPRFLPDVSGVRLLASYPTWVAIMPF